MLCKVYYVNLVYWSLILLPPVQDVDRQKTDGNNILKIQKSTWRYLRWISVICDLYLAFS